MSLNANSANTQPFEVSTDPARLDIPAIHRFLTQSHWAQGRSLELVERSIRHSFCFGVYRGNEQVAFARLVTDRTTFAYLMDVFVMPEFRGQGLAKMLMREILDHPETKDLKVILLRSRDARGFYTPFGFAAPKDPETMLELRRMSRVG